MFVDNVPFWHICLLVNIWKPYQISQNYVTMTFEQYNKTCWALSLSDYDALSNLLEAKAPLPRQ